MQNPARNLSQPAPAGLKANRIYRALLNRAMEPMKLGALRVTMPAGEELCYGSQGTGPVATLRVLNPNFFTKCFLSGDIGFGESYVDGDWETDDIVTLISWFILNIENTPHLSGSKRWYSVGNFLKVYNRIRHKARPNTLSGSQRNISEHYDLNNDFFQIFLDPSMTYSCAYFIDSDQDLESAQIEKYDKLCRKLKINSADHVLEIGGGWGGFAIHAARNYGCNITSITVSPEQLKYARARVSAEGLSDKVSFRLADYRDITGKFDKIVSIEMLEAVGHRYVKTYFQKCHVLLNKDGILGIQVITCPDSRYESYRKNVDWIQKHIFPGGLLPSIASINKAINQTGDLNLYHLEDMGLHYARTLATWKENFNSRLDAVKALGFDEKFIRKWNYYLGYCEAAFRMRNIGVIQAVYVKPNNVKM
jgi:cyclopropane-fatty-acyl-phospholipid synthase